MVRYQEESVDAPLDPLLVVARLANSGQFDEYVVYERDGCWTFAGGVLALITMDSHEVRCSGAGIVEGSRPLSGPPGALLHEALNDVRVDEWRAYGWLGFDLAGRPAEPGAPGADTSREIIAQLLLPRVEVRLSGDGALIRAVGTAEREAVRDLLARPGPGQPQCPRPVRIDAGGANYRKRVAQAVNEIRSGQYQKVVLSREVEVPFDVDVVGTYVVGRAANTPERSFLLDLGGMRSAGFSPEIVVSVDPDGRATTAPLAGTRALGRGADVDAAARGELVTDCKEVFEHAVSVRTAQRELYSVCRRESVGVNDFMEIRERGSVQHLGSTVSGVLAESRTAWDALEALFPAVTASGIPKPDAVAAIARLEDSQRGLYAGSVLTVSHDGSLEATLVLRAIYQRDGRAWLRAGAGVVADSTPERELEETCEKLASVAPFVVPRSP